MFDRFKKAVSDKVGELQQLTALPPDLAAVPDVGGIALDASRPGPACRCSPPAPTAPPTSPSPPRRGSPPPILAALAAVALRSAEGRPR